MLRAAFLALTFCPLLACVGQTPAPATNPAPVAEGAQVAVAVSVPATKVTYSQCQVDGPYIAMTYDDGPSAANTPRLLDTLKKRNIKATFFVVGQCAAENPDIMKRIVAEGHEIASHSWSHPLLSKMGEGAVTDQLQRTHDIIIETTGVAPKIMRPPFGGFTVNQQGWANRKWGYKVIMWDVDPLDWKYRNAAHVENEILKKTVAGSIILTHDIHKTTVDAMPSTLDALLEKGFKFVTVSELLAMDRPAPVKPKVVSPVPPAPGVVPAAPAVRTQPEAAAVQ